MTATIHFGMPKTGTSSIQSTLYEMRKSGSGEFAYLSGDGHVNGNRVSKILCRAEDVSKNLVETQSRIGQGDYSERESDVRKALVAEIKEAKGKEIIFSSEDLILADEERLSDFRELFLAAGSVRGVGYVRNAKSLMESLFQQRVKTGSGRFSMERLYPDYRSRFEKFDRVFGRENVDLGVFDPKKLLNGCVVLDFANRAGIDIPEDMVLRRNDALSRQALSLLFAYRKFSVLYGGGRSPVGNFNLIEKLRTIGGMKVRFHSSIVAPLLEENRDDLAWMEDRLGASLAANLEDEDAIAIKSESDLLQFAPDALSGLSALLGDDPLAQTVLSGEPEIVAQGVHAVYEQGLEKAKKRRAKLQARAPVKEEVLATRFLAKTALELNPGSGVSVAQATTLLTKALERIRARIMDAGDDGIVIEGLGGFCASPGADKARDNSERSNSFVFDSTKAS